MLFKDWFEQYHKAYCVDVITYDCQRDYWYIYQRHFQHIADMELDNIKPIDIQNCMKTTRDYSSERQRRTYFLLKRVFREAIFNGFCTSNPVEYIKPPRRIRKFAQCFEAEDIENLFACDTKLSRMFEFDLWTGLRRGELLALTWDNINLEHRFMKICQTLVRTKHGDKIVHTTKSRSERLVPLSRQAIEILLRIQLNDRSEGFLFVSEQGKPISLRNYNRLYVKFFKERQAEFPELQYLSPHKLRHSYATYMLQCGADVETLRALLGHADIETTQKYVHSNFNQMVKATENLKFE